MDECSGRFLIICIVCPPSVSICACQCAGRSLKNVLVGGGQPSCHELCTVWADKTLFAVVSSPPPPPQRRSTAVNHLEERLLDQAQARASCTPLFWGHSRSIPQGMILDVQPLIKSLFCPIRPSPNGFFDSEASIPWISLFWGVGEGGCLGGGSKVFAEKAPSSGEAYFNTQLLVEW